jgi:hypothetical protein
VKSGVFRESYGCGRVDAPQGENARKKRLLFTCLVNNYVSLLNIEVYWLAQSCAANADTKSNVGIKGESPRNFLKYVMTFSKSLFRKGVCE